MDEEVMWKSLYEKMQEAKNSPPTERESQYVFYLSFVEDALLTE